MAKFCGIFCCFPWKCCKKKSKHRIAENVGVQAISGLPLPEASEVDADIVSTKDILIHDLPPTNGELTSEPEELLLPTEASGWDVHSQPTPERDIPEHPAQKLQPEVRQRRVIVIVIEMVKSLREQSQDECESPKERMDSEPMPEEALAPSEATGCDLAEPASARYEPADPSSQPISSEALVCDEAAEPSSLPASSEALVCDEAAEPSSQPVPSEALACDEAAEPSSQPVPSEALACDEAAEPSLPLLLSEASASGDPLHPSPINLQDLHYRAVLGRGGFGKVMLAEFKETKEMFAVKTIKKAELRTKIIIRSLMMEKEVFQVISRARHPFLVNLAASFHTIDRAFFIMEFAAGGCLDTKRKDLGLFPEPWAQFYIACIVLGLEFLHHHKIIYRDLKLGNIVLDNRGFAKITDFGLSKTGIGFGDRTSTFCGTVPYMAPEMINRVPYSRDVDWWGVGVILYKMLCGKNPFRAATEEKLCHRIVKRHVHFPTAVSSTAETLIKSLLTKDPVKRLGSARGAEEVKEHPFFTDINWMGLLAKETQPPFTPTISDPEDVSNFDPEMTSQDPVLTPPEGSSLPESQREAFRDFDWAAG